MDSWNIIKNELIKKSQPKTTGRDIVLNQCADLFIKLRNKLVDKTIATEEFNKDDELRSALINREGIEELRKSGVIL